jgi:FkbM family methyltransferase
MSILVKWIDKFNLPLGAVVHVGAHEGQEAKNYSDALLEPVLWVEALPSLAERAREHLRSFEKQKVINAALWSKSGMSLKFNVSSNDGGSSSFYDFHLHSASYPDVGTSSTIELSTQTLDNLLISEKSFQYLVLDVQGAELEVLKGSLDSLRGFTAIVSEVSIRELYSKAPLFEDVALWLKHHGFELVDYSINSKSGWGDAFFVRKDVAETLGLNSVESDSLLIKQNMTLPTRIRILLIKIGINPKYFSRFILK